MTKNISVIENPRLSDGYKKRYVVVDKETGKVLDNAQGYGYKSIKGAYAAYAYLNRDKSKDKEKAERIKKIKKWLKEHKDFVALMDQISFELWKGSWGPGDKFDAKLVKELLKNCELEPEFTPGEILKVWEKDF